MSTRYTENVKDVEFPDPKYYMIGFTVQKPKSQHETTPDEAETSQNENTEEFGLNSKDLSPRDFEDEYCNQSWKNATSVITKTSLRPVDTNKE